MASVIKTILTGCTKNASMLLLKLLMYLLALLSPATATEQADRITPPSTTIPDKSGMMPEQTPTTVIPEIPTEPCAEMNYFRELVGLPYRFSDQPRMPQVSFANQGYGWREGGCNNTSISNTGCCVGYWQLHYIIFRDHRMIAGLELCGATWHNVRGNDQASKYRQACAAKVLYDVMGLKPWAI